MKEIVADEKLVAFCGLYCGACRSYLKGRCPGCAENHKATWCKVRTCCLKKKYSSCASCTDPADLNQCKKFNNLIANLFGFLFNSDRRACVQQIRKTGLTGHAAIMTQKKRQSIKRTER